MPLPLENTFRILEVLTRIQYNKESTRVEFAGEHMNYRLPEISDAGILREYMREHYENGEADVNSSMDFAVSDYSEWVKRMRNNATVGDAEWGKSLTYLCFDEARLVGLLNIRYDLPKDLSERYGNIGYGVRPSERGKGYATAMLRYALSVCKEKGLKQVTLGCYKDNLASAATIKKNGGLLFLENDNYAKGRISQYYLIKL